MRGEGIMIDGVDRSAEERQLLRLLSDLKLLDGNKNTLALIGAHARDLTLARGPDPTRPPHDREAAVRNAEDRLRQMGRLCEALIDRLHESKLRARDAELRAQEMSHRIKNGLQFVASLLRIQSRDLQDDEALNALALAGARVEAVARLHALLCDAADSNEVRLDRYLGEVCGRLTATLDADGGHRRLVVWAEPDAVSARTAQTLGLIVAETVMNAFRHAFDDGASGTVEVEAFRGADGGLHLTVADDGKGLADGPSSGKGVGTGLVDLLAKQIGAETAIGRGDGGGTRFTLTLPVPRVRARGDGLADGAHPPPPLSSLEFDSKPTRLRVKAAR